MAIKNRRVIAHGHDAGKVYLKAKRDVKKDFVTAYILSGEPFVLNAVLRNLSEFEREAVESIKKTFGLEHGRTLTHTLRHS